MGTEGDVCRVRVSLPRSPPGRCFSPRSAVALHGHQGRYLTEMPRGLDTEPGSEALQGQRAGQAVSEPTLDCESTICMVTAYWSVQGGSKVIYKGQMGSRASTERPCVPRGRGPGVVLALFPPPLYTSFSSFSSPHLLFLPFCFPHSGVEVPGWRPCLLPA